MEKGGHWFRNTVSRLVGKDCQRDWSHIGIVCFPNIENKDFLKTNQIELDEEKLKVVYIIELSRVINFSELVCLNQTRVRGR